MIEQPINCNETDTLQLPFHNRITFKRFMFYFIGSFTFTLGIIGVFLPILPTTPFLLISAACFFRSSPRAYQWLINNRFFGTILRDYRNGYGISKKYKYITLLILWFTITVSIVSIAILWVRILLILIALLVSTHIILIKSKRTRNCNDN